MAKSMDPTLEELRREQAWMRAQAQKEQKPITALEELRQEQALMRAAQAQASMKAAQAQKEQKPLTAITVALAGKENKNQTPRPDSSWQPSPQYGPYVDMQREYPITMAGLRLAEEQHQRNAETFGKPAYAPPMPRPDSSYQTPSQYPLVDLQRDYPITMAGLRLAEEQHQRNAEIFPKPAYVRPMPRPDSSWQPSPQYGPYFDMEREYPVTMAGLRLAEEQHERNAKIFGPAHARPLDLSFPSIEDDIIPDSLKVIKAGGKALAVVGYAIDALNIATAVEADLKDFDKRIGKKTAAAVGGAASSAVFGALGAAAFSILAAGMAGALMGSVLPGPGTIVGFIGGLVGGMIGAAAGEEFSDWVINQIDWDE